MIERLRAWRRTPAARWIGALLVLLLPGGVFVLALLAWLEERRRSAPSAEEPPQ